MNKARPGLCVVEVTQHGVFLSQTFSCDLNTVLKDLKQATIFFKLLTTYAPRGKFWQCL